MVGETGAEAIEARLKALGLELPPAPNPVANYVPTLMNGNLLFVSGQIAKAADGHVVTGAVGSDLTIEEGQAAARLCALNILSQAKAALGSLAEHLLLSRPECRSYLELLLQQLGPPQLLK